MAQVIPDPRIDTATARLKYLGLLEERVLWLSMWMIHHANHLRPKRDGLKVGGHQASSSSVVTLMTALYFDTLRTWDRVAIKPDARRARTSRRSAHSAARSRIRHGRRTKTMSTSRRARWASAWR